MSAAVRRDVRDPDGSGAGPAERWAEILSSTHLPWAASISDRVLPSSFRGTVAAQQLDDLTLLDCVTDPCSGVRGRRQLAHTGGEFAVLLITRRGRQVLTQEGRSVELGTGDAVLWDSTLPARFAIPQRLVKRSLVVPRALVAPALPGPVRLDPSAPATRLLLAYLDSVDGMLPGLAPAGVLAARNAAVELLLAALHGAGPTTAPPARVAVRQEMLRYLDRHLGDEDVGPARLARAHGLSERTVNRIFREGGESVAEYVRRQRLDRARGDLVRTTEPLSAIAHRWGYADLAHFSRSFKAAYGQPPSRARG
ncbi:helix-turn-helix domain-containing protein [Pseudonocardia xishanensis]|uniref:Transcriptional regulator FeaR n=1 Tax=Pseudonocardia xishanensis TaxID=630995 RepID=A0ABP8S1H9_9PSEU